VRGLVARLARRRVAFAWRVSAPPPPRAGRGYPGGHPTGTSNGYDYEGSAQEITDPAGELPRSRDDDG
jgi:hypothetical protein